MQTVLQVADNSGARKVRCIKVLGGSKRRYAGVGDIIRIAVQEAQPNSRVRRGQVMKAVVVRTVDAVRHMDGTATRFEDNAAVLLSNTNELVGTRIFGPVARALRTRGGFMRIISLAPEVL